MTCNKLKQTYQDETTFHDNEQLEIFFLDFMVILSVFGHLFYVFFLFDFEQFGSLHKLVRQYR